MKRVAELEGAELDYWVAKADGNGNALCFKQNDSWYASLDGVPVHYSSDWTSAGQIIERERIALDPITRNRNHTSEWQAQVWVPFAVQTGPTPLIAAMRALVASKFGETVDEVAK